MHRILLHSGFSNQYDMVCTRKYINKHIQITFFNKVSILIHWLSHYWYTAWYHCLIPIYAKRMNARVYVNIKDEKKEVKDMKLHWGMKINFGVIGNHAGELFEVNLQILCNCWTIVTYISSLYDQKTEQLHQERAS